MSSEAALCFSSGLLLLRLHMAEGRSERSLLLQTHLFIFCSAGNPPWGPTPAELLPESSNPFGSGEPSQEGLPGATPLDTGAPG